MPKVRREKLPRTLLRHLEDRVLQSEISVEQLRLLLKWLELEPIVPIGSWYKKFPGVTVCGTGELIKTFLRPDQTPIGTEL